VKKYDAIVVGSGISGMTLALLLGMNGRSVLLLEKGPRIGGSMTRFTRQGIPFDTGFHFTGGFCKDGILQDMLVTLGMRDYTKPIYLFKKECNRFNFEAEKVEYALPSGYGDTIAQLKEYFPGEERGIERYFEMVRSVCARTISMDLRKISLYPDVLDEDYISLDAVLNEVTDNQLLKGLLSVYSMCYGVKPSEIAFAAHSRICFSLYQALARVEGGGEAFIDGFRECFAKYNIEVRCNCTISECTEIQNKQVGRFVLSTGEELATGHCVFTIHPHEIMKLLPQELLSKAFLNRINEFEPSAGFFSFYGVVNGDDTGDDFHPTIFSLFPTADINRIFDLKSLDSLPLVIMTSIEEAKGTRYRAICALELSFPEHVEAWKDSKRGNRPSGYVAYKEERVESIRERITRVYPEYGETLKVMDAASMLTYKDYLHSPEGAAYGIKQKIGQFNLFGKLPLRNVYAAGQSSMLPGIVGAMMSSFIVARSIMGIEEYGRFIKQRLGSS